MQPQTTEIDNLLFSVKPLSDIKRFPRSICLASNWKASELKNFLLYYSIYVLQNVLPRVYIKHWIFLVHSIFYLLQENISQQDLVSCERMLSKFVIDTVALYGVELVTYNIHQLSHLVECTRNRGPLWRTSAFAFEHNNQHLLKLYSGTTYVSEQIAANFMKLALIRQLPKSTEHTAYCLSTINVNSLVDQ